MNAKEYLGQYRKCRKLIEQKRAQIQAIEELCEHITADPTSERVQTSGDKDRLGKCIAELADKRNELLVLIGEAADYMNGIEDVINSIDDMDARIMLWQRYIECRKWEEIEKLNHYSRSAVQNKCSVALKKITIE